MYDILTMNTSFQSIQEELRYIWEYRKHTYSKDRNERRFLTLSKYMKSSESNKYNITNISNPFSIPSTATKTMNVLKPHFI